MCKSPHIKRTLPPLYLLCQWGQPGVEKRLPQRPPLPSQVLSSGQTAQWQDMHKRQKAWRGEKWNHFRFSPSRQTSWRDGERVERSCARQRGHVNFGMARAGARAAALATRQNKKSQRACARDVRKRPPQRCRHGAVSAEFPSPTTRHARWNDDGNCESAA